MRFEEYRKHDAISLAGLVAKREVDAREVLETAIARAEQINPAINAIVHKQYNQSSTTRRGRQSPPDFPMGR
jgi:amidase